jgi:hypothetical protein
MGMIKCKTCDNKIASDANPCPQCGTKDPTGNKLIYKILFIAPLLMIAAYLFFVALPHSRSGF